MDRPILIDSRRATELLSISRVTLWRWVKAGVLPPPVRIGKITRWRLDEIENLVEQLSGERG